MLANNELSLAMKNDATLRQATRELGEKYKNSEDKEGMVVEFANLLQSKGIAVTEEQIFNGREAVKGKQAIGEAELEKVSGGVYEMCGNFLNCVFCILDNFFSPPCG